MFVAPPSLPGTIRHGPPFLDAIVAIVGGEHRAVLGHRHGGDVFELAGPIASLAEGREKDAVGGEPLDPVIIEIRNVYRPVVTDRQAGDRGEPAVERAEDVDRQRTASLARESAVGGELLHSVVVAVGDQENAAGAEGHVRGVIELGAVPDN